MAGPKKPNEMNILIVSQEFPYPPHGSGAKLKLYNLIKRLSVGNRIYLAYFIGPEDAPADIGDLNKYCGGLCAFTKSATTAPGLKKLVGKLFNKYPDEAESYFSAEAVNKIKDIIGEAKIDIVHFDLIYMAQYGKYINEVPKVIAPNDANWLLWQNVANFETDPFKKLEYYVHYLRTKRYEMDNYSAFDKCVVVSDEDKKVLQCYMPDLSISVIPNGVDYSYFRPFNRLADTYNLIFTGVMSYKPNIDAMTYFCKEMFPLIKARVEGVKLYIVGKDPTKEVLALASPDTIVTGYVDDVRSYAGKASVFICPLRIGAGIKNKILEAMAMGMPIVATPKSLAGIDAADGKDLLLADSPGEFAGAVIKLLNSRDLKEKLSKNARKAVENRYSWDLTASGYEALYKDIVKRKNKR